MSQTTKRETWAVEAERNITEALAHLARAAVHLDELKRMLAQGAK